MHVNELVKQTGVPGCIGAIVGIVVLHPVTSMVYGFEHNTRVNDIPSLWQLFVESIGMVFSVNMWPMTGVFALIGAAIGVGFGFYHATAVARDRTLDFLESELAQDLPSVIARGEGEHIEFKSTLRWDSENTRANRALEGVVAKTIAGFMNHRGGSLLIGVADNGEVLGLEGDYTTLKHKNRDGFERCLNDLLKTRIGGDKCSIVHCVFYEIDGKDICRVIVESTSEAVYCQDGKVPRYYLRTGNGTRELDVREALEHAATRRT